MMRNNIGHGTSLEISAKAVFANNVVTNNGGFGIKVNNTSDVSIWNNTFGGNDRSINLVQGHPAADQRTPHGRIDKRQPFPDPTDDLAARSGHGREQRHRDPEAGNCMLCVEDYSDQRTAEQIGITSLAVRPRRVGE